MTGKNSKFSVRKFDGDDQYSYAVFKMEDVRGLGGVIFWGEAKPLVCGLSRQEAKYYKQKFISGDI